MKETQKLQQSTPASWVFFSHIHMEPSVRMEYINQLELNTVHLAFKFFLRVLRHCHVLVCSENVITVRYLSHQGGIRLDDTPSLDLETQMGSHIVSLSESNSFAKKAQCCSRFNIKIVHMPRGMAVVTCYWINHFSVNSWWWLPFSLFCFDIYQSKGYFLSAWVLFTYCAIL